MIHPVIITGQEIVKAARSDGKNYQSVARLIGCSDAVMYNRISRGQAFPLASQLRILFTSDSIAPTPERMKALDVALGGILSHPMTRDRFLHAIAQTWPVSDTPVASSPQVTP